MEETTGLADPKSILLVRLGGLGDLLAVLPCVRFLRQAFPDCRLTLVCREEYGALFLRTGLVDEIESESRPRFSRLYAALTSTFDEGGSWLAGFDLVLAWMQGTGGKELEGTARRCGVPALILVYDPRRHVPVSQGFFEATVRAFEPKGLTRPSFEECSSLPIGNDVRRSGRDLVEAAGIDPSSGFMVIHPGAGSRKKRWPFQNFLAIASRLSSEGRTGMLITGETEADLKDVLEIGSLPAGWRHLGCPDLISLAGLLGDCALYIGNDSGVTHLAAACGAKVLAVFRTEFEAAWRPSGRSIIISTDNLDALSIDDVLVAARRIFNSDSQAFSLHLNLCKKP